MPLYTRIPDTLEAHVWFKNGDHPMDQVSNPSQEGQVVRYGSWKVPTLCVKCNQAGHDHGRLVPLPNDQLCGTERVCPGDYIVTVRDQQGKIVAYRRHEKKSFEKQFQLVKATQ